MMDENIKTSFPSGNIPKNSSVMRDALSGVILNFIEGLFLTAIIGGIVYLIPFVVPLKVSICVIAFIIITAFEFKGCHDYTLIIAYIHYLKWKKQAKKYELGTVETAPDKKKSTKEIGMALIEKLKNTEWKSIVSDYENKTKETLKKLNNRS